MTLTYPSTAIRPPEVATPKASLNASGDLAALRRRIAVLERRSSAAGSAVERGFTGGLRRPWRTGTAALDAALPADIGFLEPRGCPGHDPGNGTCVIEGSFGGLVPGGVHEAAGAVEQDAPTALAFLAALLVRLGQAGRRGPVAVCQRRHRAGGGMVFTGRLYGPGWRDLGLDPADLLMVEAGGARDVAWAMEECLRSGALAAVLGEVKRMNFVASRRLALAARESQTPALLLRGDGMGTASAACSRWRVTALPGRANPFNVVAPGSPRWRLELVRCRGGRPATCIVEWNRETGDFGMAAALADRPAAPRTDERPTPQPTLARTAG